MSVLKEKRTVSKAEYVNTANQIYVETVGFLTRLSARYSRLIAEGTAQLAGEVMDHTEKANKIYPSDEQRKAQRKAHLLEALASLSALDVRLTHAYLVMYQNPQGCFTAPSGKTVPPKEAMGLQVNAGKSKVVPFSRPFRFCKAKFQVTDTGAVKIHGCRDGMKRARRKLRLFQARVASGEMTVEQVAQWLQTPISYYENFNDHGRVLKLRRLFYAIFKTEV